MFTKWLSGEPKKGSSPWKPPFESFIFKSVGDFDSATHLPLWAGIYKGGLYVWILGNKRWPLWCSTADSQGVDCPLKSCRRALQGPKCMYILLMLIFSFLGGTKNIKGKKSLHLLHKSKWHIPHKTKSNAEKINSNISRLFLNRYKAQFQCHMLGSVASLTKTNIIFHTFRIECVL